MASGNSPGYQALQSRLYRYPILSMIPYGIASPSLGCLKGSLGTEVKAASRRQSRDPHAVLLDTLLALAQREAADGDDVGLVIDAPCACTPFCCVAFPAPVCCSYRSTTNGAGRACGGNAARVARTSTLSVQVLGQRPVAHMQRQETWRVKADTEER